MVIIESRNGKRVRTWELIDETKPIYWWVRKNPKELLLIPRDQCERLDEDTYEWALFIDEKKSVPDDP